MTVAINEMDGEVEMFCRKQSGLKYKKSLPVSKTDFSTVYVFEVVDEPQFIVFQIKYGIEYNIVC